MKTIILQLDPKKLSNPDLDIRYTLPDIVIERSGGRLTDGGYDYAGEGAESCLLLFLDTEDAEGMTPMVIDVLKFERVLENDLSGTPVAILDGKSFTVVHPPDFRGMFPRPDGM